MVKIAFFGKFVFLLVLGFLFVNWGVAEEVEDFSFAQACRGEGNSCGIIGDGACCAGLKCVWKGLGKQCIKDQSCTNECSSGQSQCVGSSKIKTCVERNGCWVWQDRTCQSGYSCQGNQCIKDQSCTPNCVGKECGSNGCGGSCGTCGSNEVCSSNQCRPLDGPSPKPGNQCILDSDCSGKIVCSVEKKAVCDNGTCECQGQGGSGQAFVKCTPSNPNTGQSVTCEGGHSKWVSLCKQSIGVKGPSGPEQVSGGNKITFDAKDTGSYVVRYVTYDLPFLLCSNNRNEATVTIKVGKDSDGDGVPDDKDNCPSEKGDPTNNGCPPVGSNSCKIVLNPASPKAGESFTATIHFNADSPSTGLGTVNCGSQEKVACQTLKQGTCSPVDCVYSSNGSYTIGGIVFTTKQSQNLISCQTTVKVGTDSSTPPPQCDLDGQKEGNEECDGNDFGGKTCTDFGYSGGTLSCNACVIDKSQCTGPTGGKTPPCGSYGDLDGDGKITSLDVLKIAKFIDGRLTPTSDEKTRADVNSDGKISKEDQDLIAQYAISTINTFPVCQSQPTPQCTDGNTQSCVTNDGCEGVQTCINGKWGGCNKKDLNCKGTTNCGNNILDPKEQCDKVNSVDTFASGQSCENNGYPNGGTLKCTDQCGLDVSGCVGSVKRPIVNIPCDGNCLNTAYTAINARDGWSASFVTLNKDVSTNELSQCSGVFALTLENGKLRTADTLKAGEAYLLRTNGGCQVDTRIPKKIVQTLELQEGWNLIGKDSQVSLELLNRECGATIALGIDDEGKLYSETNNLKENSGYLVRVRNPCTIGSVPEVVVD